MISPQPTAARLPDAARLLDLLDRGASQHPVERALSLLAEATPGASTEALAALPIGRRDQRLLHIYAELFPAPIRGRSACPSCGVAVEVSVSARELLLESPEPDEPIAVRAEGFSALVRLPNSTDLRAAVRAPSAAQARAAVLSRVVLSVRRGEDEARVSEMPPALVEAIDAALAAADPQADLELTPVCPGCGQQWSVVFDPEDALWTRIRALGERTLDEVDALARVYHWSEAEILQLSPQRRARYIARVTR